MEATATDLAPATPTLTPEPPLRLLTICLAREPATLFLYNATSTSALGVLAAVYDGPFDWLNFLPQPVILQSVPSLQAGDVQVKSVDVQPGDLLVDASSNLTSLAEGVVYRPAGCTSQDCLQTYSGSEAVSLEQVTVVFKLLPGLLWSDGAPLTADDSVYSYEVAQAVFGSLPPERLSRTASYQALDELTVEWTGVPGYLGALYQTSFFTPLPRHAWGSLEPQSLPDVEPASRQPLGWGPYIIDEWVAGDHISLHRNPNYFRAVEGLPHFDNLVYRFVDDSNEALQALLAGECDLVDQTASLEGEGPRLQELQQAGQLQAVFQTATAWDLLAFGISSLSEGRPDFFGLAQTRQAVAQCIDREAIAAAAFLGQSSVPASYVPPGHPAFNQQVSQYAFDPQAAADVLQLLGWLDTDSDPATPRLAQGVPGVPDGTAFEVSYLVSTDSERQAAAEAVKAGLAQCGIQVNLVFQAPQEYLAAGPEGPVFGRRFDLAQVALPTTVEPPCFLFTSREIPGPYPDFPKGWGGVNASGYSSAAYDQACQQASFFLAGSPENQQALQEAQAVFSSDLPVLPLYWRLKAVAARPDLCGLSLDTSSESALWNLEALDYGEGCQP